MNKQINNYVDLAIQTVYVSIATAACTAPIFMFGCVTVELLKIKFGFILPFECFITWGQVYLINTLFWALPWSIWTWKNRYQLMNSSIA